MLQSWDCTFKDPDTSDYVVGQHWARRGSHFLLGDQFRERTDCPGSDKTIRAITTKWRGTLAVLIEDTVIQMLSHEIAPRKSAGRQDCAGTSGQPFSRSRKHLSAASRAPAMGEGLHRRMRPVTERRARRSGRCDDAAILRWHMAADQITYVLREIEEITLI